MIFNFPCSTFGKQLGRRLVWWWTLLPVRRPAPHMELSWEYQQREVGQTLQVSLGKVLSLLHLETVSDELMLYIRLFVAWRGHAIAWHRTCIDDLNTVLIDCMSAFLCHFCLGLANNIRKGDLWICVIILCKMYPCMVYIEMTTIT